MKEYCHGKDVVAPNNQALQDALKADDNPYQNMPGDKISLNQQSVKNLNTRKSGHLNGSNLLNVNEEDKPYQKFN